MQRLLHQNSLISAHNDTQHIITCANSVKVAEDTYKEVSTAPIFAKWLGLKRDAVSIWLFSVISASLIIYVATASGGSGRDAVSSAVRSKTSVRGWSNISTRWRYVEEITLSFIARAAKKLQTKVQKYVWVSTAYASNIGICVPPDQLWTLSATVSPFL